MSRNKSLVIAITDLRMAMKARYVRYSLIGVAALGPVVAIVTIIGLLMTVPATSSEFGQMLSLVMPMGSAMLSLMAVIPAGLISANALVGEREQNTLEPLLATPLTDRELILGKALSSIIPCVLLLISGTAVSSVVIYLFTVFNGLPPVLFPDLPGLFLILVVGPTVVVAIVAMMILISGRVSRVYEAYQTGTAAVAVLLVPIVAPSIGLTDPRSVWLFDLITFAVALVLAAVAWYFAVRFFNRDAMVSRV